jgi:hypothetical protein
LEKDFKIEKKFWGSCRVPGAKRGKSLEFGTRNKNKEREQGGREKRMRNKKNVWDVGYRIVEGRVIGKAKRVFGVSSRPQIR